jgi:hypothetical protein
MYSIETDPFFRDVNITYEQGQKVFDALVDPKLIEKIGSGWNQRMILLMIGCPTSRLGFGVIILLLSEMATRSTIEN